MKSHSTQYCVQMSVVIQYGLWARAGSMQTSLFLKGEMINEEN